MAKFCKYCGKKLEKEEICLCQEIKKPEKKKEELKSATKIIQKEVTNSSKQYMNDLGNIIKGIFTKPMDTMNDFIQKDNYILGMIILVLSSLIVGFCSVSFLKGIMTNFMATFSMNNILDISYFKTLCCVSLGFFLSVLLLAVIFDLGFEKISQAKITYKKALQVIAVSVLEPILLCIVAAFLTVFSYKLSFLVLLFSMLLLFVHLYQNFLNVGNMKKNHYNHLFSILILIFIFLVIYLLPNLFL